MVSLWINNQMVDLGEESLIQFNYTMDEMTNPSVIRNTYSQRVKLPATPTNNAILNHLLVPGAEFAANRKQSFAIYNERNEMLQCGYAKIDSWDAIEGVYEITLYGNLGAFFSALDVDEAGEKRTLGDLLIESKGLHTRALPCTAATVRDAWAVLESGAQHEIYSWFNFAPMYNGLPDKFDTDKAYCYRAAADVNNGNVPMSATEGGKQYKPRFEDAGVIVKMGSKHTEWEVQDFRAYFQRPIVKVRDFFEALCSKQDNGGFDVILDFSLDYIEAYSSGWVTLPLLNREKIVPTQTSLYSYFSGSMTPAEFLISFAKMYGLVFLTDANGAIRIMTRSAFYQSNTIDISSRIDRSKKMVTNASTIGARYYMLNHSKLIGEAVKAYGERYDRGYGSFLLDTNYQFEGNTKQAFEKLSIKGAADVLERSPFFSQVLYTGTSVMPFKMPVWEKCSVTLYAETSTEWEEKSFDITEPTMSDVHFQTYDGGSGIASPHDYLLKVQAHGDNNKAEDGSGILLFYRGHRAVSRGTHTSWHLSDDCPHLSILNDNVPCWDISTSGSTVIMVDRIPSFMRGRVEYRVDYGQQTPIVYHTPSVDFGKAREVFHRLEVASDDLTIYKLWWRDYMTDRYDAQARVMTCSVDLRGFQVSQDMMRSFYWFDNCIWVLNKISNYSLTTSGTTECEFVKVQDMNKYFE